MTAQVPDTCMYDGRRWAVERWHGDCSAIPTNEQLGIKTESPSTANWSGRIDHFVIHRGKLYLLKIEVNLAEESREVLPPGAQREVLCRYETMRVCDSRGERDEIHTHRFEYFVFHDLPVSYSGDVLLGYPCIDYWELPYDADDDSEDATTMLLSFEEGLLINTDCS